MMNYVWAGMLAVSFIAALAGGNLSQLSGGVITGANDAVTLCLKIAGTLCLWNGLMNIASRSGLTDAFSKLLSPLVRLLFPRHGKGAAGKAISLNITANLLGLGNAATPLGIEAMKRMKEENNSDEADSEMVRFVVLNSAALTLIPTSVAALRASYGSAEPMSIIVSVWLSGIIALAAGLGAQKLTELLGDIFPHRTGKRLYKKEKRKKSGK